MKNLSLNKKNTFTRSESAMISISNKDDDKYPLSFVEFIRQSPLVNSKIKNCKIIYYI